MTAVTARPVRGNIVRTGVALAVAFAVLAAGAGWWTVAESQRLSTAPDNPAVIAAARRLERGVIHDRNGTWLARSVRDENGETYREYRHRAASHVVGYASRTYGTAGIERTFDAELRGVTRADPVADLLKKFDPELADPADVRLTIDLRLQRLAANALGGRPGAVVMLDPRTGEVLALASAPTYDASAISNPATADETFAALREAEDQPLLPRATLGRYTPGSIFKIVTALAGLDSGAIGPDTTFAEQPPAEEDGLRVSGFRIRDGHHPQTGDRELDLVGATEVSCNIWYALAGLEAGGEALVAGAEQLGFGAPIPFELPVAVSQVTGGDGPAPGGFTDDVELASASFGQGETFVTPLQMALVAAAVANDGELMRPRLVSSLASERSGERTFGPERWRRVVSEGDAAAVRAAMVEAVEGDLGRLFTDGADVPGVTTAGKSGTAELGGSGEPHSWFIGFAPAEAPQVAIAVIVEQAGRGGEVAAPIAGELMGAWLELARGEAAG